jgi:ATP/ADP translocase
MYFSRKGSMLNKFVGFLKYWFGDFTKEELKKFLYLGFIFALIIGTYWTLRPMKDSFFASLVVGYGDSSEGREIFLAVAKVVSLLLLIPVVTIYGMFVERFQKNNFFYMITGLYAVLMMVWTAIFLHPTIGLANTEPSHWRMSGWLWYVFVESFGSLVIALFWAIVVDTTTSKSAKRGFALIVMIGQLGGIIMPQYLSKLPRAFGVSPAWVIALCGGLILLTMILFWVYIQSMPKSVLSVLKGHKDEKKEEEPGLMDGLRLVLSHSYLMGIFGILFFFEFIATVIDFNFKSLVFAQMADAGAATEYLGVYGSSVNLVAFLCLLFGINNIPRLFGLTAALGLVPVIVGVAVVAFWVSPSLDVLFYLIVGAKAINYALNGPSIKQLYIPTSEDVKYKSQAWIETFGSRASKAAASFANLTKTSLGASLYLSLTVATSLGMSVVWFFIAISLATRCNKAVDNDELVC